VKQNKYIKNNTIKQVSIMKTERENLVNYLKKQGRIKSSEVENAFLEIPRELFVPEFLKKHAYADTPLQIGEGQTISAPHMVAIMCEELDLKQNQKILEIGAGSGYHAAIVSKIIGKEGHVYSIERIQSLSDNAKENIQKANIKNVTVETGDGSEGLEKYAPYDRIYVTCAAPDIPEPLIEQLKDPGKMLIPVGDMICTLYLIEKKNGIIKKYNHGGCAFVPLRGKYGHQSL
jgi:protein-L-isoaspartate(D-aspartate) O-methyltransferase